MNRAVLYKVGHHGSHNATLSGTAADEHPNLSWLGQGDAAREFTAMITAVNEWAMTQNHPPLGPPTPVDQSGASDQDPGSSVSDGRERAPETSRDLRERVEEIHGQDRV